MGDWWIIVANDATIKDWQRGLSCTATALSALSGKTPVEIAALLREMAAKRGREIVQSYGMITTSMIGYVR
jgi:hypothetical protein